MVISRGVGPSSRPVRILVVVETCHADRGLGRDLFDPRRDVGSVDHLRADDEVGIEAVGTQHQVVAAVAIEVFAEHSEKRLIGAHDRHHAVGVKNAEDVLPLVVAAKHDLGRAIAIDIAYGGVAGPLEGAVEDVQGVLGGQLRQRAREDDRARVERRGGVGGVDDGVDDSIAVEVTGHAGRRIARFVAGRVVRRVVRRAIRRAVRGRGLVGRAHPVGTGGISGGPGGPRCAAAHHRRGVARHGFHGGIPQGDESPVLGGEGRGSRAGATQSDVLWPRGIRHTLGRVGGQRGGLGPWSRQHLDHLGVARRNRGELPVQVQRGYQRQDGGEFLTERGFVSIALPFDGGFHSHIGGVAHTGERSKQRECGRKPGPIGARANGHQRLHAPAATLDCRKLWPALGTREGPA